MRLGGTRPSRRSRGLPRGRRRGYSWNRGRSRRSARSTSAGSAPNSRLARPEKGLDLIQLAHGRTQVRWEHHRKLSVLTLHSATCLTWFTRFQVYFPNGTGVWYGRVSSHEVGAVTKTVTEGRIYPTLLRGGVDLTRPEGKTLVDW